MDFRKLYQTTKDLSVMVVEDHTPTREGLQEVLVDLFKDVDTFSNGMDAFDAYSNRYNHPAYDLVITDIQMPRMDGVTLSRKIKEHSPEQQIIVLSAYADKDYLIELINIGISHFVPKPFDYDNFLETLYRTGSKIIQKKSPIQPPPAPSHLLYLGEHMVWDKEKNLLKHHDEYIALSKNELMMMRFLAQNGDQITTTPTLLEKFYVEDVDINESGIRNLVLRIRKKLPEDIIGTVYGMGYKLHVTP